MRKILYLSFCLMLAMAFGCAITNYGIVTDNNQTTNNGQSSNGGGGIQPEPRPINTNGKAHIRESSQIAFGYPNGTDELFSFVDQKSDGTAKLTTYRNGGPDMSVFHADFYCNPDWNGCSIWTAIDDNVGDPFDGQWNQNCLGSRSLSLLVSSGRYYGECGRQRITLQDRLNLAAEADLQEQFGEMGLFYRLTPATFSITLDNNEGVVSNLPMRGSVDLWVGGQTHRAMATMQNPLLGTVARSYGSWLDSNGAAQTTVTVCLHGTCADFDIAGNQGDSGFHNPSRVAAFANSTW